MSDATDFLRDEYAHAVEHYRHLESMRMQYMNFYFGVYLGAVAFFTFLVEDKGSGISKLMALSSVSLFAVILFLFTVYVYVNVVRIGHVLKQFERVMWLCRKRYYEKNGEEMEIWNFQKNIPKSAQKYLFQSQETAELLLSLSVAAIAVTHIFITISHVILRNDFSSLFLALTCSLTAISTYVLITAELARREGVKIREGWKESQ